MVKIEVIEKIESFKELFDQNKYKSIISDKIRRGKNHIVLSHEEIINHNPDIGNEVLDNPEEILECAESAIKDKFEKSHFNIRIKDLPNIDHIKIRELRSINLGKFICCKGYVKAKSDVRPQITSAKFECPNCAKEINILQTEQKFKEPSKCFCGRRGSFKLINKKTIDGFSMVMEEAPEDVTHGTNLKRLNILVKEDLTDSQIEDLIQPGTKLAINGILKEIYKESKSGAKETKLDLYLDANYIHFMETTFADIIITKEDEEKIKEFAKDKKVIKKITNIVYSGFYGHQELKEAIIMQAFNGVWGDNLNAPKRGSIHILIIGDPGIGKTGLFLVTEAFLPKSRFVSGTGSSGKGLTASMIKDEFLGGWQVEAGAIPLANEGLVILDEMEKAKPEDIQDLHSPMESGIVTIDKANVHAKLLARTSILAAANPKLGRFDDYTEMHLQTDFQPSLLSRFDLIFPIKDEINEEKDKGIALKILQVDGNKVDDESILFLKKYIAFAKRLKPKLTEELAKLVSDKYWDIRKRGMGFGEVKKHFPISPRQVGAIRRLAEAHARMKLRDIINMEDIDYAFYLIEYSLSQIAYDKGLGDVDLDKIDTGMSTSKRDKYRIVKDAFRELENKIGKLITYESLEEELKGKMELDEIEEYINLLSKNGDIIEVRRGFWQLT